MNLFNNKEKWKALFSFKCVLLCLCLATGSTVTSFAQLSYTWSKNMGGTITDATLGTATDASGNVFVTGYFISAKAAFNIGVVGSGDTLYRIGTSQDIFLAKYDAAGNFLWSRSMGGPSTDYAYHVAVDGRGNAYVTGYFNATADFNPTHPGIDTLRSAGGQDGFLVKYDGNGNFLWVKGWGGTSTEQPWEVALDSSGNAFVEGTFSSKTINFNPGGTGGLMNNPGVTTASTFLVKFDSVGKFVWAKGVGGTSNTSSFHMTLDGSGNPILAGYFAGTCDFNAGNAGGILTSAGGQDIFLVKYDGAGNFIWAKSMGSAGYEYGGGVATDASGNIFLTGYFQGSPGKPSDFNPLHLGVDTLQTVFSTGSTTSMSLDGYLAKYDANGNYLWAKRFGSGGDEYGTRVVVDRRSNVYVVGHFNSPRISFMPGDTLVNTGGYDAYIAKYDGAGNNLWAKRMGGGSDDVNVGIAQDLSGNIYMAGYFGVQTMNVNPGGSPGDTLASAGSVDGFLVKYSCSISSYSFVDSTCDVVYKLNDSVYTATGTYTQLRPSLDGCDSIITLNVTFYKLNAAINVNGFVLGTGLHYGHYQWYCNDTLIAGATDGTITVTKNGKYKVVVSNNSSCADTAVYNVTNYVAVANINTVGEQIKIYPNPSTDVVYIQSPVTINVMLTDMQGRTIRQVNNAQKIAIDDLADGIYLLRVMDNNGTSIKVEKIVKQSK